MSLTILCITRGEGARVAALLALFRPVAAEIVVAADERATAADVDAYRRVADRVVRFPHSGDERHLAWAHELCAGDWILRVDDDEAPSAALLARLPSLAAERTLDEVWIPRRWVTSATDAWIAEPPWWPDPQNRLIRRDAERRFSGELHTSAEIAGPALWIREPLYHLDLALNDLADRRAKARRYLQGSRGRQAPGGGDIGASYYLPERRGLLQTLPLPPDDRAVLASVLRPAAPDAVAGLAAPLGSAAPVPAVPSAAVEVERTEVEVATPAEVERAWVGRSLAETAYRARFEIVFAPERLAAGSATLVLVDVANEGSDRWERALDGPPFVRFGHRWWRADENAPVEGPRAPLPRTLAPGESTLAPIPVLAPAAAGEYRLEVALVHEHVRWFGPPVTVAIHVGPGEAAWTFAAADLPMPAAPRGRRDDRAADRDDGAGRRGASRARRGNGFPRLGVRLRRRADGSGRSRARDREVLYLGWVGHGNLGDEAVYEVAAGELGALRLAPTTITATEAIGARAALLGGGTLIGHAEYREALERLLDAAPDLPTGACGSGVEDPDYRPDDAPAICAELERWAPLLARMTAVGVRGPRSQALLAQYGVDVPVTGDPALLLGPSEPPAPQNQRVLGINAGVAWRIYGRQPDLLLDQLAAVARALADDGWRIRLISIWPHDIPYLRELAVRAGAPLTEVVDCRSVDDALAALGSCRLLLGLKLHSVVFATALRVPAVMLSYQPKCDDFMASLGRERLSVRTDEMVVEQIVELLRGLEARHTSERADLDRAVLALRGASHRHFETLRAVAGSGG